MSQIYEQSNGVYVDTSLSLNDVYKHEDKGSVVWFKPKSQVIVSGSKRDEETGKEAPGDNVIVNLKTHFEAKREYNAGKRTWENYITKGFAPEWESRAYEYKSALDEAQVKGTDGPLNDLLEGAVIRP